VTRDRVLLAALGSPDRRQIDGIGGADPLTSKVAVIQRSERPEVDVDYSFAQVSVDRARVDWGQNCGNILAGVEPFAIERGLVAAAGELTRVRIFMQNSGTLAVAYVRTCQGQVEYEGDARIDGVPGTAAPQLIVFENTAGSMCGPLLPTASTRHFRRHREEQRVSVEHPTGEFTVELRRRNGALTSCGCCARRGCSSMGRSAFQLS
jgi:4-oxalomesaconate tautomerase